MDSSLASDACALRRATDLGEERSLQVVAMWMKFLESTISSGKMSIRVCQSSCLSIAQTFQMWLLLHDATIPTQEIVFGCFIIAVDFKYLDKYYLRVF